MDPVRAGNFQLRTGRDYRRPAGWFITVAVARLGRAKTIVLVRFVAGMVLMASLAIIVREMLLLPAAIDALIACSLSTAWTAWLHRRQP